MPAGCLLMGDDENKPDTNSVVDRVSVLTDCQGMACPQITPDTESDGSLDREDDQP